MGPTDEGNIGGAADALAGRIGDAESFSQARRGLESEYEALLLAVRALDARFAFDREGRPGAVTAVREALPLMERELFDAVMDDHACEVAAIEEAMYQVVRACRRPSEG